MNYSTVFNDMLLLIYAADKHTQNKMIGSFAYLQLPKPGHDAAIMSNSTTMLQNVTQVSNFIATT